MIVGVPKETFPGELRVALVPAAARDVAKLGGDVLVQPGAGQSAGFSDSAYEEQGAKIAKDRAALFSSGDLLLFVRGPGANPEAGSGDLKLMRSGQTVVGLLNPLGAPKAAKQLAATGVTSFAMELIPRISRAQPMDVLSSMATVAGYKAVLLAAEALPKMFPMMITAAGTITPARVFVIGAGVAGLQAIASARRLGGVVTAYDVRPVVKEQVESLGARFLELPLETEDAEGVGGYAKALGDEVYNRQREMMTEAVAASDVIITTAAIPGKPAPVLVTEAMIRGMQSGSVVIDLAAESGGNCEATRPGETVHVDGVAVIGPVNLPATVPYHASQMFARNVTAFLKDLLREEEIQIDMENQVIRESLLTRGGEVVNGMARQALGLPEPASSTGGRSGS